MVKNKNMEVQKPETKSNANEDNIALQENNANWNVRCIYRVDISIRYETNRIVIYTYESDRGTTEFESEIINRLNTLTMNVH